MKGKRTMWGGYTLPSMRVSKSCMCVKEEALKRRRVESILKAIQTPSPTRNILVTTAVLLWFTWKVAYKIETEFAPPGNLCTKDKRLGPKCVYYSDVPM